ncbi:hypothetical protein [Undibacterium sp. TS12]|uniref:hypothetical protein n=1 Tax=Undibacterium sp. TS12 TaxID=2908202 RepID=UPI001F4CB312|nr:hypothetical protein [Undibacterium sp. TS12]MCH8619160.1 hypothetical protein [Undibacterium sp. TS12]
MSKSHVDANYRFIAANQEVNTRIAQRHQSLALYVTLVVSLLAALVALKPGESNSKLPIEWLVLGFPVASICLAFLNYKAERAITNLRQFLSALERLENAHYHLPSYNTDPRWAIMANKARRFQDYASAVLVIAANAIGLGAVIHIYPERIAANQFVIWISGITALISLFVLLFMPAWSYRPASEQEKLNDESAQP